MRAPSVRLTGISLLALTAALLPIAARPTTAQDDVFWLTVLHHSDGESQLLDAGPGRENFGGAARFKSVIDALRAEAEPRGGSILVSAGDNFLAGPELAASLRRGVPFFDSIALDAFGYDAIAIGNHEFDFGPDVLADFIAGFADPPPFLSANLDFTNEPRLLALVDTGVIAPRTVVQVGDREVGIVGVTTESLPFVSSPRNTIVAAVAPALQAQVDLLEAQGVQIVVLLAHLQGLSEVADLIPRIRGVDLTIAGGGGELLANAGDLLVPGDEPFGPYPSEYVDADGVTVPVATGPGDYTYLGRMVAGFDPDGVLVMVDEERSGPRRVSGLAPDAVDPDAALQVSVSEPLGAALAGLAATIIAQSEVPLDGGRDAVRSQETNLGDLFADALLARARSLASEYSAPRPVVALQNGGGIRNDSVLPAGDLTELDTFDIAPFGNFVTIVEDVPPQQFLELMENAVSRVEDGDGRFAQIAGFRIAWDPAGRPQKLDSAGDVVTRGHRVRTITLDDGTVIVDEGTVLAGAPAIAIATTNFLARGGDQYPFRGATYIQLPLTDQQALVTYIVDDLGGGVSTIAYPEGGAGRIRKRASESAAAAEPPADGGVATSAPNSPDGAPATGSGGLAGSAGAKPAPLAAGVLTATVVVGLSTLVRRRGRSTPTDATLGIRRTIGP